MNAKPMNAKPMTTKPTTTKPTTTNPVNRTAGTGRTGGTRTVRVARWSARHPWRVIALWLVFVAAAISLGSLVNLRESTDLDTGVGQSGQAQRWMHDAHLDAPDTENVLITARHGRLDAAQVRSAVAATDRRMASIDEVASVGRPVTSTDGTAVSVELTLGHDVDVGPVVAATAAVQRAFPALRVEQVGGKSLNAAVNTEVGKDLGTAAELSLPVTLVILLVAFGAIVAAGVPVLLALSAVGAATGLSTLASHVIPDSGSTSSMILLMGMAVGVDYSLFYVKRARAERHAGHDKYDAIEVAAATSGHSVLVSGLAVTVAMLGLFVADDVTFASLALGSIIVVLVAVIGALTVLPALLAVLGNRIDRPRVPVLWRWTMRDREPRLWSALLRPSLNRPARTLVISVLALAALAVPALGMATASSDTASLPGSIAEKHSLDRLTAAFPDKYSSTRIVVTAPSADAAEVHRRLARLGATLVAEPGYVGRPTLRTSTDRTVQVLEVAVPYDSESAQARASVLALGNGVVADRFNAISGLRWAVGGDAATNLDADRHGSERLPWVIGFVVLLTMAIMGWVFRSLLIAVVTALVNLLSAGAAFGVLTLVFQHTWAEGVLGFHSTGTVVNWIPLFTFAVLFGLSMDYHVFVLGRIREAARNPASPREAVRQGIVGSAGTVTSAAVVMVSVFAIFASLPMAEMKQLGVGLAAAVLIDAIVVRIIVLPALLVLLRWPRNQGPGSKASRRAEARGSDERAAALSRVG